MVKHQGHNLPKVKHYVEIWGPHIVIAVRTWYLVLTVTNLQTRPNNNQKFGG